MDNLDSHDPDLREAAIRLGVSMDTLRKRIKRGQTPAYKADGRWYVPLSGPSMPESGDRSGICVQRQEPGRGPERTADMQFLHEEIERLWGKIYERDALIARLTAALPALPVPVFEAKTEQPDGQQPAPAARPTRPHWWRRLFTGP
jgi:hypothetical protein